MPARRCFSARYERPAGTARQQIPERPDLLPAPDAETAAGVPERKTAGGFPA